MKNLILTILLLQSDIASIAQSINICSPTRVIVVADSLNFREGPGTNHQSIEKLDRGNELAILDVIKKEETLWNTDIRDNWLKVVREEKMDTGFVFGHFVRPVECAYRNYGDETRIQEGNWYGINIDKRGVFVEKIKPKIVNYNHEAGEAQVYSTIQSGKKHSFLICSKDVLLEGEIRGVINRERKGMKIGDLMELNSWNHSSYSIMRTGEYINKEGWLRTADEGLYLVKRSKTNKTRTFNLGECLYNFSYEGVVVEFVGDLNSDGIPEILLSEADNKVAMLYYFKSNKNGELLLQSITYSASKC